MMYLEKNREFILFFSAAGPTRNPYKTVWTVRFSLSHRHFSYKPKCMKFSMPILKDLNLKAIKRHTFILLRVPPDACEEWVNFFPLLYVVG